MGDGGVPRVLRSEPIYAAAAANAQIRGLALPVVALRYRYVPVTALHLIRRCCHLYCAGKRPGRGHMVEEMTVRITEAELARDVRAVMAKVEPGSEVIIEQEDHRPIAVIRALHRSGRPITEILEEAKRRNSTVTLDKDFGRDLEEIIASHQQPWHPPSWD